MRKLSLLIGTSMALVAFLGLNAQAQAIPPIDLLTNFDVRIDGAGGWHQTGGSVSDAGDVNGDGLADMIVGARYAENSAGLAYVVFGGSAIETVDLAGIGTPGNTEGFRIDGAADSEAGDSVSGAGDINGDGYDDVIVGARVAENNGRWSGSAYIVFGKSGNTDTVELANFGDAGNTEGFRIDGSTHYFAGDSVSGAGDVNGDDIPDVIVGTPGTGNNYREDSGSAHVVFGKSTNETVGLANFGDAGNAEGFRIDGGGSRDRAGYSVSGVGDVNGDDIPDVIVGSHGADNNGRLDSGSAYTVFGKSTTETIDLANFGDPGNTEGFRIDGAVGCNDSQCYFGDQAGWSVSGVGDVNGDDIPDVIVGARWASNNDRFHSGSAYTIFGKSDNTDSVDLANIGTPGNTEGFGMDGAAARDWAGWSVSGAGDVNDDGIPDVIVGANLAINNDRWDSGSAYVVFGKSTVETVDFADIGTPGNTEGFRVDGADVGDQAGSSVSGADDFNADGCPDVIVGAVGADNNDRRVSGSAYIIDGCDAQVPECSPPVIYCNPNRPDCSVGPNDFAIFRADFDTPDSYTVGDPSKLKGGFVACGTENRSAATYEEGGSNTQNVRFDVSMPPGVGFDTGSLPPQGSYMGRLDFNIFTWRGNPQSPAFIPRIPLSLRVAAAGSGGCPQNAEVCLEGRTWDDVRHQGSNWSWITEDGGRYTYTIGEFVSDDYPTSPAGISKVYLTLCSRPGSTEADEPYCPLTSSVNVLTNGSYSAPDCSGGQGPNGIYTVTATRRSGATSTDTAGSRDCVPWILSFRLIDAGKIKPLPPGHERCLTCAVRPGRR